MQVIACVALLTAGLCAAQSSSAGTDSDAAMASMLAQVSSGAAGLFSEYGSLATMSQTWSVSTSTQAAAGGAPGETNNRGAAMPAATPFIGPAGVFAGAAGIAAMMI